MTPSQAYKAREKQRLSKPRYCLGQELGETHIMRSGCTGKDCPVASDCARVNRRGNTIYTGPLLHMRGEECVNHSRYVDSAESIRGLHRREVA